MNNNGIKKPITGFLEWFHVGEHDKVEESIQNLKQLSIDHLRTGISWADDFSEEGRKWHKWLIPRLAREFELLPCLLYTPPSIGVLPKTSAPPKDPKSYADFADHIITNYGKHFEWIELWNEPNNLSEYDYTLDSNWTVFADMIGKAAYWSKHLKKKTLLGGMSPVDPNWLQMMYDREVMTYIDAVGVHHFPYVFDDKWYGWSHLVDQVSEVVSRNQGNQKIWITETGYSTWQHDERKQLEMFLEASTAPVDRMYWYGLNDLDKKHATVDGFHIDEREYAFGITKTDGTQKLLYRLLSERKIHGIEKDKWMSVPRVVQQDEDNVLVIGGAGFIGTNLVKTLMAQGLPVTVFDNLSRPGVEKNLRWLKDTYPDKLNVEIADIRNAYAVRQAVNRASFVFHFAAQVAVTTSCIYPETDFDINAKGTLNVLEAIRESKHQPPLIFTSTNKVYGGLEDIGLSLHNNRYEPEDTELKQKGISEQRPLDFHSPYGCSKGIADSYIHDYARTFGLKAVVFRMSCIYGPHQFGTEDQGWIAHFLIKALQKERLTIYGDGKQVRDILYVDDLVNAMLIAADHMDELKGRAFNMGGGAANSISLLELVDYIRQIYGEELDLRFDKWRPGDQRYYVSDTSSFKQITGWQPKVNAKDGIKKLYYWLLNYSTKKAEVNKTIINENSYS